MESDPNYYKHYVISSINKYSTWLIQKGNSLYLFNKIVTSLGILLAVQQNNSAYPLLFSLHLIQNYFDQ